MEIKIYNYLPDEAMDIRKRVFVEEQGFCDFPDESDRAALHILIRDGDVAIACARLLPLNEKEYLVGRIAVLRERRGEGLGRLVVESAETVARERGASRLVIHAQKQAAGFYFAIGYSQFGDEDEVEGRAHLWMEKAL